MNTVRSGLWAGALAALCAAPAVFAEDWPQWRGIHRDGKSPETGLLNKWPDGGPPLAWKATGLGEGYSTPSVADGKMFGMGFVENDEVVWALDERTGKMLWSTPVGRADRRIDRSGTRATPTVDGKNLYTLTPNGVLVCLDTEGKLGWRVDLQKEYDGKMMSGWGYSESPLVDGDQVLCTPGGKKGAVLALDKKNGKFKWQTGGVTDEAAYSSIIVAEIDGVRQYIQLTSASVLGVSPDGAVLWQAERRGRVATIPTPIYHDNHVFVTSGYGDGCNLFKISRQGTGFEATEVYANKDLKNHHGGVVLVDGYIYGYSDPRSMTCLEFLTGNVAWEDRSVGKGSVAYADGHIYLRSESGAGTVALIEATPSGYREKSKFDQPDRSNKNSWPHPVIVNGHLLLRDQDILLRYDIRNVRVSSR